MKNLLPILFLFHLSHSTFSQNRDNTWMLGGFIAPTYPKFGLDFSSGTADTFSLFRDMNFFDTNAGICDTSGQLLFYTNGIYVANRNHDSLFNTAGFNPGWENTYHSAEGSGIPQGVLIIPKPASNYEYYIFHESAELFTAHSQSLGYPVNLSYSLIDMTLDGGLGGITSEKNIHIINDTLLVGRITGCKHANGRDWWIIVHQYWTDLYYKLLVTPYGIQGPYIQQIGFIHDKYDPLGQAVFSPDGTHYVYLSYDTTMDIMNFDRCTGDFSNAITITVPDTDLATLGCAFSPSSRYLYVSNNNHVYQFDQFDTWNSNIASTKTIVATYDGYISSLHSTFFMMQLARDNKIYLSTYEGTDVMHVINNPDQLACNLVQHQLHLPSFNALGLPNAPNYNLSQEVGSVCDSLAGTNDLVRNENEVVIFPNPCINLFSIESISKGIKYFYIEDLLGKTIFARRTVTNNIDVSTLSKGIYIVHIVLNNDVEIQSKLSKE
jgi:hypothetical protein